MMRRLCFALLAGAGAAFAASASCAAAASGPASSAGVQQSDHARAQSALSGIRAAITTIMDAENATVSGPVSYKAAAHSAINALVGTGSHRFDPHVDNPGDKTGAIGQVNHLLDRVANPPFVPVLHGVLINLQAAAADLDDAINARSLTKYELYASRALEALEIAEGRPGSYDVLGGMVGAIANTELGVPEGAPHADGCAVPQAPGYGMWQGWLVWHAIDWHAVASGAAPIATNGAASIRKENSMLVLYTPAAPMVQHHCAIHAKASPAATPAAVTAPAKLIRTAAESGGGASYTKAQATAGKAVYTQNCASCHGADLQGVAAPAIAGKKFMPTAEKNGYTVSILHTIVADNMPFNNPGGLTATQYANVTAYLLAANCYPAGSTAFPENPGSGFGTAKLATQKNPSAKPDKNGVCAVD